MNRAEKRRQRKRARKAAEKAKPPGKGNRAGQLPSGVGDSLNAAVRYHAEGELAKAEGIYRDVLKAEPDQPIALHLLGVIAHQVGEDTIAVELITKATAVAPDNAKAHCDLGNAFMALGDLARAAASYRQATRLKADYAVAFYNLGNALRDLGETDEAAESYRKAIAINPDLAEAHNNYGVILKDQRKTEEAADSCRRAVAIAPDFAEAHNNLGNALRALGQLDEAAESYRQATVAKPGFAQAHNNLGAALHDLGRLGEAEENYRRAIAIDPGFADAHYDLHALLLDSDDLTPAMKSMETAVEKEPRDIDFRFAFGMLLDYSGKPGEAAAHLALVEEGSDSDRAKLDAWRHIKSDGDRLPRITGSMIKTFGIALAAARNEGLVLEFGVRFGNSIRQISALADQEVHGLDSFEGLPERWHDEPAGSYTTKGVIPAVPENVVLHKGWFDETLPRFLAEHRAPARLVNIDCDIYGSTKTVLDLLAERIVSGTVLVFDEYVGNAHWRDDEFKAFQEAVFEHGWAYEYLSFSFFTKQVVVRIN